VVIAKEPYYVSFIHDRIPQQADHSRSQPGPTGSTADRAGHTSVTSRARLTIAWDTGPAGADGQVPLFAQSVTVVFRLTDFVIGITSDYAVGSCAYRATLQHELEAHVYEPIRIFHSYRDVLVRRLNGIAVPTRERPLRVAPSEVASRQAEVERPIVDAIARTKRELLRDLQRARDHHDSPASYSLVYNQCTDAEWASGR
jgi:hypothetical protein